MPIAIEEGYKHADVRVKLDILNKLFGCIIKKYVENTRERILTLRKYISRTEYLFCESLSKIVLYEYGYSYYDICISIIYAIEYSNKIYIFQYNYTVL